MTFITDVRMLGSICELMPSTWLSADMANALAAVFGLQQEAVVQAAAALADQTEDALVVSGLLRQGAGLTSARGVVEALTALREFAV